MKFFLFTIFLFFVNTEDIDNIHSVIEDLEKSGRRKLKSKKLNDDDMELDIFDSTIDADQAAGYDESHVENAKQMAEEQAEPTRNTISTYPHIMLIGERTNKFYNYHKKLIERPKHENIREEQAYYHEQYSQTREMLISIVLKNDIITKEINQFMKNISTLEIVADDLVKFFGFEDFFNDIKSKIPTDDLAYDENVRNLDLFVNTVTEDVVNFFLSLFKFTNIGHTLKSLASSQRETVGQEHALNYQKINASVELVKGVLHVKKQLTENMKTIEEIMEKNHFLRLQLMKQLVSFEDREKADQLENMIQKEESQQKNGIETQNDEDEENYSKLSRVLLVVLLAFY